MELNGNVNNGKRYKWKEKEGFKGDLGPPEEKEGFKGGEGGV